MKKLIFCLLLSTAVVISDSLFAMDDPQKPPLPPRKSQRTAVVISDSLFAMGDPQKPPLPPRKSKQIPPAKASIDNKTELLALKTAVKIEVEGSKVVKLLPLGIEDESIKTFLSLSSEVIIQILDYTANHPIINNPEAIYANHNQLKKKTSVFYSFRETCKSWEYIVTPLIPQLFISSQVYVKTKFPQFSLLYPSFISILDIDLSNHTICQEVCNVDLYKNVVFLKLHTRDSESFLSKSFCNMSVNSLELLLNAYTQKVKYLEFSGTLNEQGAKVLLTYLPSLEKLEILKLSFARIQDENTHAQIINALPQSIKKICFTHGLASDLPTITEILRKRPHLNSIILESSLSLEYGSRAQGNDALLATPNYKEMSFASSIMGATKDSLQEFKEVVKAHPNYKIFTYCLR